MQILGRFFGATRYIYIFVKGEKCIISGVGLPEAGQVPRGGALVQGRADASSRERVWQSRRYDFYAPRGSDGPYCFHPKFFPLCDHDN